jgi:HK97 gp10 family phage protein
VTAVGADASELRRLAADLAAVPAELHPRAADIVGRTAHAIEGTAKQFAPVLTGALRSSIGADVDGLTAEIGPTVHYAGYVEEGTSRMQPQPYMRPAADRHEPGFVKAFEELGATLLDGI